MKLGRWMRIQWDRCVALAAAAIGLVALLAGWHGVADQTLPAGQIPYVVSGGVGGLFALGIGATMWIAAELRDQWHKLDRIESALREERASPADVVADAPSEVVAATNGTARARARATSTR